MEGGDCGIWSARIRVAALLPSFTFVVFDTRTQTETLSVVVVFRLFFIWLVRYGLHPRHLIDHAALSGLRSLIIPERGDLFVFFEILISVNYENLY